MEPETKFLEFAEECDRLAAVARDEHQRAILKEMADVWRQLAKRGDSERRR